MVVAEQSGQRGDAVSLDPNNVLWQVQFEDQGHIGSDYVTHITLTPFVMAGAQVHEATTIKPRVVTSKTPVKDAAGSDNAALYRRHVDSQRMGEAMFDALASLRR